MIKIEKGIPCPTTKHKWKDLFDSMEVGDSFLVSEAEAESAASTACRYGFKVATRKQADGKRVWLLGKPA